MFVLGIPVVLLAAVIVIGLLLPAEHTAVSRIRLEQPRDAIWAVISDFENYPDWRPDVTRMKATRDGAGWEEEPSRIAFRVLESDPPSRLVTEILPGLPFGGTLTIRLVPEGLKTAVILEERGTIRSPLFRFVARYAFGYHSAIDGYLKSLSQKFGEEPAIEHVAS
jgi:hypothetical protein